MSSPESTIRPSVLSCTTLSVALLASKRAVPDDALVILPRTHKIYCADFSARARPSWKTSPPVRACPHRIARVSGSKAYLGNHTKVGGVTRRRDWSVNRKADYNEDSSI